MAATTWTFVRVSRDGTFVGATPPSAVSEAGVDLAQLGEGERVDPSEIGAAALTLLRQREIAGAPPPPPPPKPKEAQLERCRTDDLACERRNAIARARAAGILGEQPVYPSCGAPTQALAGAGFEAPPPGLAPAHTVACPLVAPDETATYAVLVLADRDASAAMVVAPLIRDAGARLVRLGVTSNGTHARTIALQLGQNTPGPPLMRPPADRVLVLDAKADLQQVASRANAGHVWIWVREDVPYGRLVELLRLLTVANAGPIVLTLDDPR